MPDCTPTFDEQEILKIREANLYIKSQYALNVIGLVLLAASIKYQFITGLVGETIKSSLSLNDAAIPWALYFIMIVFDDWCEDQSDFNDKGGIHTQYATSMLMSAIVFPKESRVRIESACIYFALHMFKRATTKAQSSACGTGSIYIRTAQTTPPRRTGAQPTTDQTTIVGGMELWDTDQKISGTASGDIKKIYTSLWAVLYFLKQWCPVLPLLDCAFPGVRPAIAGSLG